MQTVQIEIGGRYRRAACPLGGGQIAEVLEIMPCTGVDHVRFQTRYEGQAENMMDGPRVLSVAAFRRRYPVRMAGCEAHLSRPGSKSHLAANEAHGSADSA